MTYHTTNLYSHDEIITGPRTKPVSLTKVKTFLGLNHKQDDRLLNDLIEAATDYAELATEELYINRTYKIVFWGEIPKIIRLGIKPVYTLKQVRYRNILSPKGEWNIANQTEYRLIEQHSIMLLNKMCYGLRHSELEIEYVAGYGSRASMTPAFIRQAILDHVHHLYSHRDKGITIPDSVRDVYRACTKRKGESYVYAL